MPAITIFTPTHNRGYILPKLFESLQKQTFLDFEWIIVDNCSNDDTPELVEKFKRNSKFPVQYLYKKDEGKPTSINEGAKLAKGKWFFTVDSDDYLTPNAIERVMYYCEQIEQDKDFAGVVGLRGNSNGKAWTGWHNEKGQDTFLKEKYIDATSIEYRYRYKIKGDRAEVVRTEIMKQHPFPKFNDEKILSDAYLWISLAKEGYKFRWFNEIIYITEYLEDGITRNIRQCSNSNPIGIMKISNLKLSCAGVPCNERLKNCYNYYKYGMIAGEGVCSLIKGCNSKLLTIAGLPLALVYRK
jgi:glycosyltransferase involved in cell wall biosynthesis